MGRSHSSITSFRKAAWAKVQREGSGEMQPHSSLRSCSLSRALPLPLSSSSLFLCLILPFLSSSLVFSLLYSLFCFLSNPFSHPPSHIILLLFFLLSLLSSPPALAQQGRSWQQGTSTAVALPLLLPPVRPGDTSLRTPGGQGGLTEKSGRFRS